jgi:DeoR family transcriptional regulator of aga operon
MVEHSERLVIVADGSKLGQTAMASVTGADRIATLITDDQAPAQELLELEALGVEVVQVTRPPRRSPGRSQDPPGGTDGDR